MFVTVSLVLNMNFTYDLISFIRFKRSFFRKIFRVTTSKLGTCNTSCYDFALRNIRSKRALTLFLSITHYFNGSVHWRIICFDNKFHYKQLLEHESINAPQRAYSASCRLSDTIRTLPVSMVYSQRHLGN